MEAVVCGQLVIALHQNYFYLRLPVAVGWGWYNFGVVDFLLDNLFWVIIAAVSAAGLAWTFRRAGNITLHATPASLLVARERGLFLDIRPAKEFANGRVAGARNIPASEIANKAQTLNKFKDKPVVLVCKNGMQSRAARPQLEKMGFTKVHILSSGIAGWQDAQLPLVTK